MGIRFTTNTWRAPLQLIDCWLPLNQPAKAKPIVPSPRALQRFIRAGWLNRSVQPVQTEVSKPSSREVSTARHCTTNHHNSTLRWTKSRNGQDLARSDARMVISGRLGDVCAELDRLVALEHRHCR